MFARLLLLLTVVPVVELTLLVWVGSWMGVWPTVGLVVGTALLGSFLAKYQGLAAWRQLQQDLATGRMPQDALLDGIAVMIAATLLITPGVLSDLTGILLMIPACRKPLKTYLKKRFLRSLTGDGTQFIPFSSGPTTRSASSFGGNLFGGASRFDDGDIIDVTPRDARAQD